MKIYYKGKTYTEQDMDDALYLLKKEHDRIKKEHEKQLTAQTETVKNIIKIY